MSYNKLVRDKITQIIERNEGRSCKIRILNDDEYLAELNKKVLEEVHEKIKHYEEEASAEGIQQKYETMVVAYENKYLK